jgi:hypothetical protein
VAEGLGYRQRVEKWVGIGNSLRQPYPDTDDVSLIRDRTPVELSGPAGTVVLIHAGISHCATPNTTQDGAPT